MTVSITSHTKINQNKPTMSLNVLNKLNTNIIVDPNNKYNILFNKIEASKNKHLP